jgi:hypothetical protein
MSSKLSFFYQPGEKTKNPPQDSHPEKEKKCKKSPLILKNFMKKN